MVGSGRIWKDPETEQKDSETTKQDLKTEWVDPETEQQDSESSKQDLETEWVDL